MEITLAELNLLSPRERRHVLNAMLKIAEKTKEAHTGGAVPTPKRSRWLVLLPYVGSLRKWMRTKARVVR